MMQTFEKKSRMNILHEVEHSDQESWVDFFENCSPLVLWLCHRKGIFEEETCHRILEMVMVKMESTGWKIELPMETFRRKVLRTTVMIVTELQKIEHFHGIMPTDDEQLVDQGSDGIDEELNERLSLALKKIAGNHELSILHINVLHLFILGKTVDEIADSTGYSVSKIYAIKHYMMKMLSRLLD